MDLDDTPAKVNGPPVHFTLSKKKLFMSTNEWCNAFLACSQGRIQRWGGGAQAPPTQTESVQITVEPL